jgi:hypothetical protein
MFFVHLFKLLLHSSSSFCIGINWSCFSSLLATVDKIYSFLYYLIKRLFVTAQI